MKKFLIFLTVIIGLISCAGGGNTSQTSSAANDRVEVIYFHGKKRCPTCKAIEENTKEVMTTVFAYELQNGTVVFKIIDITTPDGEKTADNYEVSWSSLFVNKWKNGKETRDNMTEFAFGNARKNPDAFKKTLAEKIHQSLK